MKIILDDLIKSDYPTLKDVEIIVIEDAYNKIKEWYRDHNQYEDKVIVHFSKPTNIQLNRYKNKVVNKYKMKFFTSNTHKFCYTTMRRTGWRLDNYMEYKNIVALESIDISAKEQIYINGRASSKENEKKIKALLKCRHENVWQHLTSEEIRNWCSNYNKKSLPKNIKYLKDKLHEVMNNKSDYRDEIWAYRNTYYIECENNNGNYECTLRIKGKNYITYKLLNPTTMLKY